MANINLVLPSEEEKAEPQYYPENELLTSVKEFYEEEDTVYHPLHEKFLVNYYNNNLQDFVHRNLQFQFSFGKGGEGQDWVVSVSPFCKLSNFCGINCLYYICCNV